MLNSVPDFPRVFSVGMQSRKHIRHRQPLPQNLRGKDLNASNQRLRCLWYAVVLKPVA
jgi:hypothetical protein